MTYEQWASHPQSGVRDCEPATEGPTLEEHCKRYISDMWPEDKHLINTMALSYLVNRDVVWDFHGVLCPLRATRERTFVDRNTYFVKTFTSKDPFKHRKPPTVIMKMVNEMLEPWRQYVCSVIDSTEEFEREKDYIAQYYPKIPKENIYGVSSDDKKAQLLKILYNVNWQQKPIMVDDQIGICCSVEDAGCDSLHVSMLMP